MTNRIRRNQREKGAPFVLRHCAIECAIGVEEHLDRAGRALAGPAGRHAAAGSTGSGNDRRRKRDNPFHISMIARWHILNACLVPLARLLVPANRS